MRLSLDQAVREFVSREIAEGRLAPQTGIAVSVVRKGHVAYESAFGLRDRARALPVTTKTMFDIGSLSKSVTAAALLQLHERERLDIHEPLRARNLIELRGAHSATVDLADILSHRAGLPAHDCLWYFGGYSTQELASRLAHLEPVPGAFREIIVYNNALYGCTSRIIEDTVNVAWDRYVTTEILAPLGMTATTAAIATGADDEAVPYVGQNAVQRVDTSCIAAAGGLRSNVEDMSRWALFQLGQGGALMTKASLDMMHEAKIPALGMNPLLLTGLEWLVPSAAYGFGWFLGEARGRKAIYHMGFIDGFSAVVVLFPDLELGIVVLANANLSAFPGLLAQHVFGHMTGDEAVPTATVPPAPTPPEEPAARDEVEPPREIEGTYVEPAYGRIDFVRKADGLGVAYRGHEWPLRFQSPNQASFTIQAFGLTLPISASFGDDRVAIPFSLDPRVPAQVFVR